MTNQWENLLGKNAYRFMLIVTVFLIHLNFASWIWIPRWQIDNLQQTTQCAAETSGQTGCGCPAKQAQPRGFPFKDNAYDYCHQNSRPIWWVVGANLVIIVADVAVIFSVIHRLSNRRL